MSFIDERMIYDENGKRLSDKIGVLSDLQTQNKDSLVGAVNEHAAQLAEKAPQSIVGMMESFSNIGWVMGNPNMVQAILDMLLWQNQHAINVMTPPYNAKLGEDATAAIQQAIDDAATNGGGGVLLPAVFLVSNLRLKTKVFLRGVGYGSGLKSIDNNSNDYIVQFADKTQYMVAVQNMYIDGNKKNQTHKVSGIFFDNGSDYANTADGDFWNSLSFVFVKNCSGDAFRIAGNSRENRIFHCAARYCDGYSLLMEGTDNTVECFTSAHSGLHGIYNLGSSNRYVNCKVFGAGKVNANSDGYYVGYGCSGVQMSACEAQENSRNGFTIIQASGFLGTGLISDSNGVNIAYSAGFNIDSSLNCKIIGQVFNREHLAGAHKYASVIQGESALNNDINITAYSDTVDKPLQYFNSSGVINCGNKIIVNGINPNVKNIFPNPDLLLDSDGDGIADGLKSETVSSSLSVYSKIDFVKQAQMIQIFANSSTSANQGYAHRYDIPVNPGDTITAVVTGIVNDPSKTYLVISANWYNSSGYIGQKVATKAIASTHWDTSVLVNAVAPSGATVCRLNITLVAKNAGDTGTGFYRDLAIGKVAGY